MLDRAEAERTRRPSYLNVGRSVLAGLIFLCVIGVTAIVLELRYLISEGFTRKL